LKSKLARLKRIFSPDDVEGGRGVVIAVEGKPFVTVTATTNL
jgi:hypothetical protein